MARKGVKAHGEDAGSRAGGLHAGAGGVDGHASSHGRATSHSTAEQDGHSHAASP